LPKFPARLPPAVVALAIQAIVYIALRLLFNALGLQFSALQLGFACGMVSAGLGYALGLARWWLPIQMLFVPALTLMLGLTIPPAYYLIAFLVLLVVYWSTFTSQVPLYLSSDKVQDRLLELLPSFIDLGCGMGGVIAHLARSRPDMDFHGVETAPLPFVASLLRNRRLHNCHVRRTSFWNEDLGPYDVVYAYLSPVPMERLWKKAKGEMRAGTLFVSNSFEVLGQAPDRVIPVNDGNGSVLYLWLM
jgi:hypothetical protein